MFCCATCGGCAFLKLQIWNAEVRRGGVMYLRMPSCSTWASINHPNVYKARCCVACAAHGDVCGVQMNNVLNMCAAQPMVLWLVRRLDAELRPTTTHASRGWLHLRIGRSMTSAGVSTLAFIIKLATTPNIASVLVEQWPIP